jgi:MtrB/PioB family decaheme-associated outer membrane protein
MHTRLLSMVATLLLIAAAASAQEAAQAAATVKKDVATSQPDVAKTTATNADIPLVNEVDFGVRGTAYGGGSDQARYQHYRDLRDGATFDRVRFFKETDAVKYNFQADNVGYRDQRFSASYMNYGKVKANFEWNQIPIFYSTNTRTLYDISSPGTLTMSDGIQAGIQNKVLTLNSAMNGASPFDMQTRRDVANFVLSYSATPNVDFGITFRNTQKTGTQPWGGSFGISGAIATELPVPIDHRTTDFGTSVEYSNEHGFARLGYDASFFHNNLTTLTWDNPSRVADSPTLGPVQGRMALWPNTDMNTFSASGGLKLPGHSNATAYLSIGSMNNNNPLIPFTVNTQIVSPALSRPNSDVNARITAMNYTFTSRPVTSMWFSARYRVYDFDNRTVPFAVTNSVNYDTAIVALNNSSEPFGSVRHTFDADATYSPIRYVGFRAGYTREDIDRTYRIVEKTTEDIGRVSVDLTGLGWMTLRSVFEHSKRTGTPVDEAELVAIGEQPSVRQYDISDRNQNRFNNILTVIPVSQFSVNVSAGVGSVDYPGTNFGLRSGDNHFYAFGADYVPSNKVSLGATYGYEAYDSLQASRTSNPLPDPTFLDPRRDWTDSAADRTKTFSGSMDLIKVIARTDIKIMYDTSRGESTYSYGLAPNTTLPSPLQLTPVTNTLQRATVDGRYFITKRFAVGAVYWFDKYEVSDFALNPVTSLAQPATGTPTLMMVGYFYAPYTANTVMGRISYLW